ncbi:hypothetical protein [Mesorhizobium sp. ZC-5]|uniref:hypothetical protein n=1 Tax=Mesorhizobium sp. ZC-5 TaxID=2986066 RepID=UPI0021E8D99B|nr:hypothetical protein [Mesorhizobium sp. ZC-5]MCV3242809.1 hypothetical protein [Mesorhizobium sp. ZC-5]
MYALPISDTTAIAVDDADEDTWWVHVVDFAVKTFESFSVEGVGHVDFAHYDTGFGLLWIISDGTIFAIKRSAQQLFEVDMPEDRFFAYSMVGEGSHVYVSGEYSNLWRIALPAQEWEPLLTPEPKPPRSDNEEEQTRRTREYARKYPPYYFGFKFGSDYIFCGALGALARVRGTSVETQAIDTAARLVSGRVEGAHISLSADTPRAEIYLGDFDGGFEVIFSDNLRAFHRTALHAGRRYLGVAEYPPSRVENLYVLEAGGPVLVETGAAREPLTLISLSSTDTALWAIDRIGIFRLSDGAWTLVDIDDLRSGVWPAGG